MTRPRKKSRRKRDSNAGSAALEADALPLGRRGGWHCGVESIPTKNSPLRFVLSRSLCYSLNDLGRHISRVFLQSTHCAANYLQQATVPRLDEARATRLFALLALWAIVVCCLLFSGDANWLSYLPITKYFGLMISVTWPVYRNVNDGESSLGIDLKGMDISSVSSE